MLLEDTITPKGEDFERLPRAIVPLLEASGAPLDAETLGEVASSYNAHRTDPTGGPELLRLALKRGNSGPAAGAALFIRRATNGDGSL